MFFHGSFHLFDFNNQEVIYPKNLYTSQESVLKLEKIFEQLRPSYCLIPRIDAVYLCDSPDLIDYAGGYTDYIYSVEVDYFEKSDLAWYSQSEIELENGNYVELEKCVLNYWNSIPFSDPQNSLFEFRTKQAKIINLLN